MQNNEIIEEQPLNTEIQAQEVQETPHETQFYPTREEFYLIPFLLCIIILMLFFKWTFPMKGGKNL